MAGILHDKIVEACKRGTPIQLTSGDILRKLPFKRRPLRIPDLYYGNELAVEALTLPNADGRLTKFGYTYKNLALAIPVPDNITEIWLYDPATDTIEEKLRRNINKLRTPRIELECLKCGYKWTPRSPRTPKMCPSCKRRDWTERLEYKAYAHTITERKPEIVTTDIRS